MSAYAKLRRKRQLFVDEYVRTGMSSVAATASGYGGRRPDVAGSKILANPEVKAAIVERTEQAIAKAGMRHVRIVEEMAVMALASHEMARGADGKPLAFKDLPPEYLRGSQSIEFHPDGSIKTVRLAKTDGIRMAAQYLKLLTEVHQHQGRDGGPIETKDVTEITDLEKARRVAHLLMQGLRAARPISVLTDENKAPSSPVSDDESDV